MGMVLAPAKTRPTRRGARRRRPAVELDINSYWVTFNSYRKSGGREARKLLAGMTRPALRYLTPDDRDFFAVGTR